MLRGIYKYMKIHGNIGICKHWPCPKVFLMTFFTSPIQWSTHKRARVKMSFLQTGYGKTEVWRLGETNRLRRWVGRDALRCVETRWDALPETKSTRDKAETPARRNQGKPANVWSTVYCPTNAAWFLSIHWTPTKLAQLLPYELHMPLLSDKRNKIQDTSFFFSSIERP